MYRQIISLSVFLFSSALHAQGVADYVRIALEHNPSLKASQRRVAARLEKRNEARGLGNTAIGGGYFVQRPETGLGPQQAKVSLHQTFPRFGVNKTRRMLWSYQAEAATMRSRSEALELAYEVRKAYYGLYGIRKEIDLFRQVVAVLQSDEDFALGEIANGKASMVDVLRIRMDRKVHQRELETALARERAAVKRFNWLLNRAGDQGVRTPDSLSVSRVEERGDILKNPKLQGLEAQYQAAEQQRLLAKRSQAPQLTLGLDYILVGARKAMPSLAHNGRDVLMPMLSLQLPLFSPRNKSRQRQAVLQKEALDFEKQGVRNALNSEWETAWVALQSARDQALTYQENTADAARAIRIELTAYQTGNRDFTALLQLRQLSLKQRLARLRAVVSFYQTRAKITCLSAGSIPFF